MAEKKTGPKGGRDTPVNGERVLQIVHMRDDLGMYFRNIAEELSVEYPISGQGVFAIYKRWRPWAIKTARAEARAAARESARRSTAREAAKKTTKKVAKAAKK